MGYPDEIKFTYLTASLRCQGSWENLTTTEMESNHGNLVSGKPPDSVTPINSVEISDMYHPSCSTQGEEEGAGNILEKAKQA